MPDSSLSSPVRLIPPDLTASGPRPGIALCLSGGGYRAMLFHIGCLWRLNEAGLLGTIKRISSVSGGSITAAVLGMNWRALGLSPQTPAAPLETFLNLLVKPIRKMASTTIDGEVHLLGYGPRSCCDGHFATTTEACTTTTLHCDAGCGVMDARYASSAGGPPLPSAPPSPVIWSISKRTMPLAPLGGAPEWWRGDRRTNQDTTWS